MSDATPVSSSSGSTPPPPPPSSPPPVTTTPAPPVVAVPTAPQGMSLVDKLAAEEPIRIVQQYMAYAVVGGIIPIPFVDIAALTAINYLMINAIAAAYGQSTKSVRGKQITAALLGGILPQCLTVGVPGSLIRYIPFIGTTLSFLIEPGFAALVTYGIGRAAIVGFKTSELQGSTPTAVMNEFANAVNEFATSPQYEAWQVAA